MQILLLAIIVILSVVLYRMLSTRRVSYPYTKVSRRSTGSDTNDYLIAEADEGIITIDEDTIIVEGQEYSLKGKKGNASEAFLNIREDRLISVGIRVGDEVKMFFIDPQHNQIENSNAVFIAGMHAQQHFIFSV